MALYIVSPATSVGVQLVLRVSICSADEKDIDCGKTWLQKNQAEQPTVQLNFLLFVLEDNGLKIEVFKNNTRPDLPHLDHNAFFVFVA